MVKRILSMDTHADRVAAMEFFVLWGLARAARWRDGDMGIGEAIKPLIDYSIEIRMSKPVTMMLINTAFQEQFSLVN